MCTAATVKSLQSCPTLCDPIDGSPPGSPIPGILQARTLEWVCHFLLQCMKVKSESEVSWTAAFQYWSGVPLPSPMHESEKWKWSLLDGSLPVLEWGAIAFSKTLHTPLLCVCAQSCPTLCDSMGCNPPDSFPGKNTGVGCHSFLQGIFPTQGWSLGLLHWQVDSLSVSQAGKPLPPPVFPTKN